MKKNSKKKPAPRPDLPLPQEVLGLTQAGQQAPCTLVVAEARPISTSGKGTTIKVAVHITGGVGGFTGTSIELVRPSPAWSEFVGALVPEALDDIDLGRLVALVCNAVGTAESWLSDRLWVSFADFTPLSVAHEGPGAGSTAVLGTSASSKDAPAGSPDPMADLLAGLDSSSTDDW